MVERRSLDFPDFDAINHDVKTLLLGHDTVGAWSLAEILSHLCKAVRLSMRGTNKDQPLSPLTPDQADTRNRFFMNRKMAADRPMPGLLLAPSQDKSAEEEAMSLLTALAMFQDYHGSLPAHPFLGPLTRDEWIQFHCIHCAHHLSFALPTS